MINFDSLPKDKPANNSVEPGRYTAVIFDAKMMTSKTTNNEYLNVSFKIDSGGFVNENYFDSDKQFILWKLGNLLKACNVKLEGEGTLKDIAKVIKGKKVIIDVAVNDRGYGTLDYSNNNEGIYSIDSKTEVVEEAKEIVPNEAVAEAIETDPYADF